MPATVQLKHQILKAQLEEARKDTALKVVKDTDDAIEKVES